jgi:hypothetical protein
MHGKAPKDRIESKYTMEDVERIRTNLNKEFNTGTNVRWRDDAGDKQTGSYYGRLSSAKGLVGAQFNVYPLIIGANQNFTAVDIKKRVLSLALKADDGTELYPAFMFNSSDASKVFPSYTKGVDRGLTIGPYIFMTNEVSSNEGHEAIIHYSLQRAGEDGEHDLGNGDGMSKKNTSSPGSLSQTEVDEILKDVKTIKPKKY